MPVTMTFSGEDVSEVFAQMREALNVQDDPAPMRGEFISTREGMVYVSGDGLAHRCAKDGVTWTRAATPFEAARAEAAMADAEQYAAKASKEQHEKELFAEAAKTTRQRKPKEEPAAEPVAEQVQEPSVEEPVAAVTLDYTKDVAPAVIAYNTRNGREATIALLGEFGASNAKDIKPDLWPELLERLS